MRGALAKPGIKENILVHKTEGRQEESKGTNLDNFPWFATLSSYPAVLPHLSKPAHASSSSVQKCLSASSLLQRLPCHIKVLLTSVRFSLVNPSAVAKTEPRIWKCSWRRCLSSPTEGTRVWLVRQAHAFCYGKSVHSYGDPSKAWSAMEVCERERKIIL